MAVRLNVLVLRPFGAGSSSHDQCDDLLGHLLGRPGLDVTLLERLPTPEDGSTETLALESIGGHAACLAWQDPEEVVVCLAKAGRPVMRRPHAGDPGGNEPEVKRSNGGAAGVGRMYFFDMRRRRDSLATLSELQSLLKTLQVATFQIFGTSPPAAATVQSERGSVSQKKTPAADGPIVSQPVLRESRSADPLDRLMDELEEFDI